VSERIRKGRGDRRRLRQIWERGEGYQKSAKRMTSLGSRNRVLEFGVKVCLLLLVSSLVGFVEIVVTLSIE